MGRSTGTSDDVLPIEHCGRQLVPRLRRSGCTVRYAEFEGGHFVPEAVAIEALGPLREG